ncbi:MAG: helix-turn-helix transcriptional regulator [Bacteroidia bacterium]|nr:helix-turn-helix transcriptional regulator [Bacteroidia bacterium]
MNKYAVLKQHELLPLVKENGNDGAYIIMEDTIGKITEARTSLPHIRINRIKTALLRETQFVVTDAVMPDTVNICATLAGKSAVHFKGHAVQECITPGYYHGLYVPESEYTLTLKEETDVLHVAIDRQYYADLLDDSEFWSATLRSKLLDREWISTGKLPTDNRVLQILVQILENPLKGQLHNLLLEAKVMELMALQLESALRVRTFGAAVKPKDKDVFHDLKNYLDTSFTDSHSLGSLCRLFGLNEFKLKQGFKATFGTTVFDYIHDLKMKHAWHLLTEEGRLVNEVSGKIGYRNPNHFSTAFKKRFGISPMMVRQRRATA